MMPPNQPPRPGASPEVPPPSPPPEAPKGEKEEKVGISPAGLSLASSYRYTEHFEEVFACGCITYQINWSGPKLLKIWCGQPDCLRLAQAGIAFDARQYAWQRSRGINPVMVEGLVRHMRTPLPQTIPPPVHPLDPPGVIPFGAELGDELQKKAQEEEEEQEEKPKPQPVPPGGGERPSEPHQPPPQPHRPPPEPPKKK